MPESLEIRVLKHSTLKLFRGLFSISTKPTIFSFLNNEE